MKPAGYLLLLLLAGPRLVVPAAETPAMAPVKFSDHLNDAIRGRLPKFIPKPASTAAPPLAPAPPAPPPDPDVLVLPKVVVKEWRPPTNDPDVWLTERSIQQKAMAAYQGSLTGLEWALNSWYIPLFGSPPSARGCAYYASSKYSAELERLDHLARVISQTDPPAATKIQRALDH
jgi:hypothetical protein